MSRTFKRDEFWDSWLSDKLFKKKGILPVNTTGDVTVSKLSQLSKVDPWGKSQVIARSLTAQSELFNAAIADYRNKKRAELSYLEQVDEILVEEASNASRERVLSTLKKDNYARLNGLRQAYLRCLKAEAEKPISTPIVRPYFADTGSVDPNILCIVVVDSIIFKETITALGAYSQSIKFAMPQKRPVEFSAERSKSIKPHSYGASALREAVKACDHLRPGEYIAGFKNAGSAVCNPELYPAIIDNLINWDVRRASQPKY
jgi:hypothetical protein